MPKENRFAGLGEAMQSEPSDDEAEGDETGQPDESEHTVEEAEAESAAADAVSRTDEGAEANRPTADTGGIDESRESEDRETTASGEAAETAAESERDVSEETSETEDDGGGPAFEFEATTAKSIYVREETLERLDDAEFEVESLLRREHGVRDLTGREFHDALIHVAATYVDEIADVVVDTREE